MCAVKLRRAHTESQFRAYFSLSITASILTETPKTRFNYYDQKKQILIPGHAHTTVELFSNSLARNSHAVQHHRSIRNSEWKTMGGKKALVTIRNTHSELEDLEKIELEIEIIQCVRGESNVSRIQPGAGGVGRTNRKRRIQSVENDAQHTRWRQRVRNSRTETHASRLQE